MERVVDSQMCVACCSCQLVIGAPLITQHYILPGLTCWEIRGSKVAASRFSRLHLHQKALSAASGIEGVLCVGAFQNRYCALLELTLSDSFIGVVMATSV